MSRLSRVLAKVSSRRRGPVILCPASAYHVDELGPLGEALGRRGYDIRFLVAKRRLPAVEAKLRDYRAPVDTFRKDSPPGETVIKHAAAIVALKDWGAYRPLFEIAEESGVPNFAKVEGAQDFEDADVPWDRRPYTTAGAILCQGRNDYERTCGPRHIVGNSRLERLWLGPARSASGLDVTVNLNFTWGVLEEVREEWLRSVVEGCRLAGLPYTISLHPDETARPDDHQVADRPMSELLTTTALLVSRFSTVPFEAMARGVPFIYHNPHGETVPTFQDPDGAFDISTSAEELAEALRENRAWIGNYRERCERFFLRQVDVDPSRPCEERTADVIEAAL